MRRIGLARSVAATLILAASLATVGGLPTRAGADGLVAGTAGTDTALKATNSSVTVNGSGDFSNVAFSVNQSKQLANQAVSVTWKGATPPVNPVQPFADHFMQIFQCWGDDGGPNNPGPPPEQCEFGGAQSAPNGGVPPGTGTNTGTRYLGTFVGPAGQVPFDAVDGTMVPKAFGAPPNADQFHQSVWLNPYFDLTNTNEDDWGRVFPDGTGSEQFQVDTGLEAPGLGCGQETQPDTDGSKAVPKCWLVIVPRGAAVTENGGASPGQPTQTSPLSPSAWANRVVIPLQFNPVDSPCTIGSDQRRLVGSELAASAITNWQPTLCSAAGATPYSFAPVADNLARQQLVSGTSGMAVVSRPLGTDTTVSQDPVIYAPLTLSGIAVAFNVARAPANSVPADEAAAEQPLLGSKIQHINLTPRLMAKLLTESYRGQLSIGGLFPAGYDWATSNPVDLTGDKDFLQYNPEFKDLRAAAFKTFSGAVVEEASSDSAFALWNWILSDPAAKAWLGGGADNNTPPMKVNPVYSYSSGFGTPIPDNFPKSDPYCYQDTNIQVGTPPSFPRPLCMLDWTPYATSMQVAAQETGAANDGAKTTNGIASPAVTADTFWISDGAETRASQSIISITDTASAARYGLQVASLSAAGDDGATPTFVAPDAAGLVAGEKAMTPSSDPAVLQGSPSATGSGAYPLTTLAYAAVTPDTLDAAARADYATLINYAAGPGQVQGLEFGQLPPGYAPLPDALKAAGIAAAAAIKNFGAAPAATAATTSTIPAAQVSNPAAGVTSSQGSRGLSNSNSVVGIVAAASSTPAPTSTPSVIQNPIPKVLRTLALGVGLIRYTLPVSLLVGAIGALVAALMGRQRRKATASAAQPSI